MAKRPCVLNGLEKRGGGGWRQGGPWRQGPVTKIIDRRQRAVMRAGIGGPASPGESTPSCGGGPGAPRRQKASRGDQRQRADAMSRVSPPIPCSVLKQSPLLHPAAAAALIRTSPAVATDGTGVALNGGAGGTPWGQMSDGPVTNIVGRRQPAVMMAGAKFRCAGAWAFPRPPHRYLVLRCAVYLGCDVSGRTFVAGLRCEAVMAQTAMRLGLQTHPHRV